MRSGGSHLLSSFRWTWRAGSAIFLSLLLISSSPLAVAQTPGTPGAAQSAPPNDQKDQNIPDAPSTVQPSQPPPENPQPAQEPEAPPPQQQPQAAPPDQEANPSPPPPVKVRTVPQGGETKDKPTGQDEILTLKSTVNQVIIPVTVKDESGHLVNGLTSKDFTLLENGKKQPLNFFTSDPFALSAAVILDLGMKDVDLQKVNHTFPALEGAFSPFDEISFYTYSNAVSQLSGWGAVGQKLSAALDSLRNVRGENNGPAITG